MPQHVRVQELRFDIQRIRFDVKRKRHGCGVEFVLALQRARYVEPRLLASALPPIGFVRVGVMVSMAVFMAVPMIRPHDAGRAQQQSREQGRGSRAPTADRDEPAGRRRATS